MVLATNHQSYFENQLCFCRYRSTFLQQFFSILLLYNALLQDYRHQLNQSFLVHQPTYISKTILEPYEPLLHKLMNRRVGDIYLKLPLQFLQIFCKNDLNKVLNLTFHKELFCELVLNHLEHRAMLLKQLLTLNNQCMQFSFPLQYLLVVFFLLLSLFFN